MRLDSPLALALARISAVLVSIMRPVICTTAVDFDLLTPPMPKRPVTPPSAPPPTLVFLSSRPNCVMLPMMMASTPNMRAILAALDGIGAVAVGKILLGDDLVELLALDHRIHAVGNQAIHQHVRDSLADILIRAEQLRDACSHRRIVEIHHRHALLLRFGDG